MPSTSPNGFEFERPDEEWLSRVRSALRPRSQDIDDNILPQDGGGHTAGARLGAYELIRQVGVGGMGTVWLARRADGLFDREVAIKLIKRGMDTDAVVRRFRTERHVLATLVHPHIARLYDGGSTPDGRPFLVMEYVEGLPILDYCETRGLNMEERLLLFRTVCHAVDYAHRRLILHRDLKPSNILVKPDGTPVLLDFGIAKLLDESGGDALVNTSTDVRALTPLYASPEQVRGERLTTSTDVYSLGVVLYQLLTGRSPYQLDLGTHSEIERAVLAQDAPRPSQAILQRDDLSPAQSRRLHSRLRGDLDTIVMAALDKDIGRRYPSAEQLAEDLRRHAEGLPLLARRAGFVRRSLRLVRRNRTSVIIATIAAASALAISAAVTTYVFLAPRWADEHLRKAHLALLSPEQGNGVWNVTFYMGRNVLSREKQPNADGKTLRAALADYDRARRFRPGNGDTQQERDTVWLALTITESPGTKPSIPDRLWQAAPVTSRYATEWCQRGRIPELTDDELDAAGESDLRCLGLLTMLALEMPDALRAWSRLRDLEADPLIEALFGVLHLSVEQPERAYPRLLSAYRRYPECGFLCGYLADAALDCGDTPMAGALLAQAEALENHDSVLGMARVQLRYYLATGQDDRAEALIATQPLLEHNPVAAVQFARHRFAQGGELEALEILGRWCLTPVSHGTKFSPFRVNREYLDLAQRWWSGLDATERADSLHQAMGEPASDRPSLFRVLHDYRQCTERINSIGKDSRARVASLAALRSSELETDLHAEMLEWYERLEIRNAHRWWQFSQYPPELRRMQVQAWLDPDGRPTTEAIAQMYESWRQEHGQEALPPYVKLLPSPESNDAQWRDVHLAGDHALIRTVSTAPSFRRIGGAWRRQDTLAAPSGTSIGWVGLDQQLAVLVCRPNSPSGDVPARILTFSHDATSADWQLRSDQALAELATGGFAYDRGVAVITGVGPEPPANLGSVNVRRWDPRSEEWVLEQVLDEWSASGDGLTFLNPAVGDDSIVIGTTCATVFPCNSRLHVLQYMSGQGQWIEAAQLIPPGDSPLRYWNNVAIEHDTLVATARGHDNFHVFVYRRDARTGEWRLEQQLDELLPSPVQGLGTFSLDIAGDRVTAGASYTPNMFEWHTDVHVFEYDRDLQAWSYAGSARPVDRGFGDAYGQHAFSGNTLIVGASGHDAAGIDAGVAYIFDLSISLYRQP